ncbi:hypothetical protein [Sandaracinus amylolyticus]|uniref:hypothetical protein n=1 Tax=Sandaracinus amylolyticus TaxID=927083 RepID=UPI001F27570A|nr:hypothetical protein [Sandaracinus amylolyticus]UJR79542.1 Hypothetical protein I5071_15780 [Sandaracinus amylolyticus]
MNLVRSALVGCTALALAACATSHSPSGPTEPPPEPAPTPTPTTPERTLSDDPAVATLPAGSREELARSPLPMLVLPAAYAARSTVMAGERWCAISYRDEEIAIALEGSNRGHAQLSPEELQGLPAPRASVRGQPARETINEGIRSLAWMEGDVAYSIEIECSRPSSDTRCTESAFLSELASGLVPAHEERSR